MDKLQLEAVDSRLRNRHEMEGTGRETRPVPSLNGGGFLAEQFNYDVFYDLCGICGRHDSVFSPTARRHEA